MKVFRLRPVVVQAIQVTGTNHDALREFCGEHAYSRTIVAPYVGPSKTDGRIGYVWADTWSVWLGVQVGDWIERGAHGALTVVRPHHMPARYQAVIGAG